MRPWFVVDTEPKISYLIANSFIFSKELGAAMVDAALNSGDQRLLDNAALRKNGQAALSKQKYQVCVAANVRISGAQIVILQIVHVQCGRACELSLACLT